MVLFYGLLIWLSSGYATIHAAEPLISVTILGKNSVVVNARIDNHATVSRLAVSALRYIPRSNRTIVQFAVGSDAMVVLPQVTLSRPLIRDHEVPIPNGGIRHEPVITLDVCVAGHDLHNLPFILIEQQGFTPPMILDGRDVSEFLKKNQKKRSQANHPAC